MAWLGVAIGQDGLSGWLSARIREAEANGDDPSPAEGPTDSIEYLQRNPFRISTDNVLPLPGISDMAQGQRRQRLTGLEGTEYPPTVILLPHHQAGRLH